MRKSIHTAQYGVLLKLLVAARENRGLTQVALAQRLRLTQSSVSKVERGERRLDMVELYTWCQALGVPFVKFVGEFETAIRGL